jgi:hypothetical protein
MTVLSASPIVDLQKSVEQTLKSNWVRLHAKDRLRIWDVAPSHDLTVGIDHGPFVDFADLSKEIVGRMGDFLSDLTEDGIADFLESVQILYPVHWRDAVDNGIASSEDVALAPRFDRQMQSKRFYRIRG